MISLVLNTEFVFTVGCPSSNKSKGQVRGQRFKKKESTEVILSHIRVAEVTKYDYD